VTRETVATLAVARGRYSTGEEASAIGGPAAARGASSGLRSGRHAAFDMSPTSPERRKNLALVCEEVALFENGGHFVRTAIDFSSVTV